MPNRTCSVDGCDAKHAGRGYCRAHGRRLRLYGDPLAFKPYGAAPGPTHRDWRGDDVGYSAVHRRLTCYRGRAKDMLCVACQATATGWAYQHCADDEKICEKTGNPYTTDLSCYEPMCSPCHMRMDARYGWTNWWGNQRGYCYDRKRRGKKWRAYVTWDGKQYGAGLYWTEDEARAAVEAKRKELAPLITDGWLDRLEQVGG